MEFYLVVLIFITCMIILALLIYYCQEKVNPKYSFTDNQQGISAIALAVAAPGLSPTSKYRNTDYYPPPGFVIPPELVLHQKQSNAYPPVMTVYPPTVAPLTEYAHVKALMIPEDDTSDSGSSSSSKIYFSPNSAAYSVNKRMSMTVALAKRMSIAASQPTGARPSIPIDVGTYLLAKRMSAAAMSSEKTTEFTKNKTLIRANTSPYNPDFPNVHSTNRPNRPQLQKSQTIDEQSTSPSESASARSSTSRPDNRNGSTHVPPANVIKFNLKSKNLRGDSPYTPLRDSPNIFIENEISTRKETEPKNPSPPKRNRKLLVKQSESLPTNQSESICLAKRSESLPPKHSENILSRRSDSMPPKANAQTSDRLNLSSSEVSHRSHSPTPLHTVEEEE